MNKRQLLQDPFLENLCREQIPVALFLVNGIKLHGTIESFDQYVIVLGGSAPQVVFKHAISTIVPVRHVHANAAADAGTPEHVPAPVARPRSSAAPNSTGPTIIRKRTRTIARDT